ncbi:MAG: hypothetical protein M3283_08280 [Actinomycetota bacterium]|jgi:hypothetical protein|nr:hypothetical protein [Actinomycetota bacterium]
MGFEESALTRLRRYREEADLSLEVRRGIEEATRRFSERLFVGLEYAAALGRRAGFGLEAERAKDVLVLRVEAAKLPGAEARLTLGLVRGVAAETDEDLMHEALSRFHLDPSGYSGRILGWSEEAGEEPCQTFAVYGDGVWKTKGLFVAKARGRVDDPDDVLNGFCLRVLGRLVDLAALTGGAGRRWTQGPYTLPDLLSGKEHPTKIRWPR